MAKKGTDQDLLRIAETLSEITDPKMPDRDAIYIVTAKKLIGRQPLHYLVAIGKDDNVYTCAIDLEKSVNSRTITTRGEWNNEPLWVVEGVSANGDANALVTAFNNGNHGSVMKLDPNTQARLAQNMPGETGEKIRARQSIDVVATEVKPDIKDMRVGLRMRTPGGFEVEVGREDYDAIGRAGKHVLDALKRRGKPAEPTSGAAPAPAAEDAKPVIGQHTQLVANRGDIPLY